MHVFLLSLLAIGQCGGGHCCNAGMLAPAHRPCCASQQRETPAQHSANLLADVWKAKAELRAKMLEIRLEDDEGIQAELRKDCERLRVRIDAMQNELVAIHKHLHHSSNRH